MKVLYAIQGTGNGHLSRARHVIPILEKYCDLDIIVSGTQSEVKLPYPIKYKYRGLSFILNEKGGVDPFKTFKEAIAGKLLKQILDFPVKQYDLVINDFEPVSAWAAKFRGVPCVAMSHQAAFLSSKTPRPRRKEWLGEAILRFYAPANAAVGFHFDHYDKFVETPVIRHDIRSLNPKDEGYYTVYLPALSDKRLIAYLNELPDVEWEVFSRYTQEEYRVDNVRVMPVGNESFLRSLENCRGILTGAGFESPAEAMFLGKKVFVVPPKRQYEQHCNAAAMERIGIPVMWKINDTFVSKLREWVDGPPPPQVNYPERTEEIILMILEKHGNFKPPRRRLRRIIPRKIKTEKLELVTVD